MLCARSGLAAPAPVAAASVVASLPAMVQIDWRRLVDPPRQGPAGGYGGWQDSDGGFVSEDEVVTAFGYTAGGVPGFLNSAQIVNLTAARRQIAQTATNHTTTARTGCGYEYPGKKCPVDMPALKCTVDAECTGPHAVGVAVCFELN